MEVNDVIRLAKKYGDIPTIHRLKYMPYNMDYAMKVFAHIGRQMSPSFVVDDGNRWVYEQLIKWLHGDDTMMAIDPTTSAAIPARLTKGIYLAGNTGSGKSMALAIMSIYRRVDNIMVDINENRVALNYKPVRVDEICDAYANTGDISKFKKMAILCVQDFGAEPTDSQYMGNRINVMQQILEYRGDRQDLITLISSNLSMGNSKIEQRYGNRVVSRLKEMCNYIVLKGADRRTIKP